MSQVVVPSSVPRFRPNHACLRVPLGDVCRIDAPIVDPKLSEYCDLPHINGANIESGTGRLLAVQSAADDGMTSGKYLFDAGVVLYSKLRPYLQKVVVADFRGLCSADMYPLVFDRDRVDLEFAKYCLLADDFTNFAIEASARARMPKLNREQLLAFEFPLPPLAEQRRISGELTAAMEAVERARRAAQARLAAAEALSAAYLSEVFEGPDAKRWHQFPIGELTESCSGATPPRGNAKYFGGEIPWVKTGELKDGLVADGVSTEETVTQEALRDCSLPLLPRDTLLIAMYGQGQTRGRTGLLAQQATTNQACFAILPNPDRFHPRFLQYWFRANYHRLRHLTDSRGGNQPNLNGVLLRQLLVPIPSVDLQSQHVESLDSHIGRAEAISAVCRDELAAIDALPTAYLRQAFEGLN